MTRDGGRGGNRAARRRRLPAGVVDAAAPSEHAECGPYLVAAFAALGVEVTLSTLPPLVSGPYTVEPFRCPHKVWWWPEPTGEQLARWARDDVR